MTDPGLTLTAESLAGELGLASASAARRAVLREGIPFVRIGRRILVRREALDAWLREREERRAPAGPPPVPTPPPWAVELLNRGRHRGPDAAEARRRATKA